MQYQVKQIFKHQPIGGGDLILISLDEKGVVRKLDNITNKWIPMNELPTPIEESEIELLEEDLGEILRTLDNKSREGIDVVAEILVKQNKAINQLTKRVRELESKC